MTAAERVAHWQERVRQLDYLLHLIQYDPDPERRRDRLERGQKGLVMAQQRLRTWERRAVR